MNNALSLFFYLLTTLAKLIRPGGYRTVIAENLLLKQQLIIHSRSRQRSPNLSTQDRTIMGFFSLFLSPRRITRAAIIIRPSTILRFHGALVKRKYQLPYAPMSHPFVERLIGSVRRELLDQTFFWTQADLENKLRTYQQYYNQYRCHSSRSGATPVESSIKRAVDLNRYRWKKHCRGLFQLPVAA